MFYRWLAVPFLTLTLSLTPVQAQSVERGHSGLPREEDEGARTAALPYTVAAFCAILVLVVVCMPTRKS